MIFTTSNKLKTVGSLTTVIAFSLATGGCDSSSSSSATPVAFQNFQQADMVIGQQTFTERSPNQGDGQGNPNHGTYYEPRGRPVLSNSEDVSTVFYIPDTGNLRLQYYLAGIPDELAALPNYALGVTIDFFDDDLEDGVDWEEFSGGQGTSSNFGYFPTNGNPPGPFSATASDDVLFVADPDQNRIMAFSPVPGMNSMNTAQNHFSSKLPAEFVVGQEDPTEREPDCAANRMHSPRDVIYVDGMLIVADTENHRVLVFNAAPDADDASADLVLGQADMTSCEANRDGLFTSPFGGNLNTPTAVWSDGERLVVADTESHRVLVWESFPTENGQTADFALGQSSLSANLPNRDLGDTENSADADTLWAPQSVWSDGEHLFVADTENNRVLIWNNFPVANGDAADAVLGQENFENNTANDTQQNGINQQAVTNSQALWGPAGVYRHGEQLIVTDTGNHRHLVFTPQPVTEEED